MAARKRSSFGSVTRLEKDVYRLRWWDDTPQGRRRCSETVHGTRRQADDRLAQIRLSVGSAPGGSVTLGQAYERWFLPDLESRYESGEISRSTRAAYLGSWKHHVSPRWEVVPVSAIRPLDVQDWLLGMTTSTANVGRLVMRQILSYCLKYEVVQSNVMDVDYRMPNKAEKSADKSVYSLSDLCRVFRGLRGSVVEPAFILSAFGSCRVGESLAVKVADVVALGEVRGVNVAAALVDKQVDNFTGRVVDRLKNRWSRRYVVVAGPVASRLSEVCDEMAAEGHEWLCDDGTGKPISQNMLALNWKKELKRMGVAHASFRNLRNSWETFMHWDLRVDPTMIERMMGHVGEGVTARHYDRPDYSQFAAVLADAYKRRPYFESWDQ